MQTKPKEVMERYANNSEFKELMTEFSKIMGEHFENLGKAAAQQQSNTQINKPDKEAEVFYE